MFDKVKREKLVEKINQLGNINDFNHVILVNNHLHKVSQFELRFCATY